MERPTHPSVCDPIHKFGVLHAFLRFRHGPPADSVQHQFVPQFVDRAQAFGASSSSDCLIRFTSPMARTISIANDVWRLNATSYGMASSA
jgi:hypothetical protein